MRTNTSNEIYKQCICCKDEWIHVLNSHDTYTYSRPIQYAWTAVAIYILNEI